MYISPSSRPPLISVFDVIRVVNLVSTILAIILNLILLRAVTVQMPTRSQRSFVFIIVVHSIENILFSMVTSASQACLVPRPDNDLLIIFIGWAANFGEIPTYVAFSLHAAFVIVALFNLPHMCFHRYYTVNRSQSKPMYYYVMLAGILTISLALYIGFYIYQVLVYTMEAKQLEWWKLSLIAAGYLFKSKPAPVFAVVEDIENISAFATLAVFSVVYVIVIQGITYVTNAENAKHYLETRSKAYVNSIGYINSGFLVAGQIYILVVLPYCLFFICGAVQLKLGMLALPTSLCTSLIPWLSPLTSIYCIRIVRERVYDAFSHILGGRKRMKKTVSITSVT